MKLFKKPKKKYSNLYKKDLKKEARIADLAAYIPLRGASQMDDFYSPDSYVFLLFEKSSGTHTIDFEVHEQKGMQLHLSFPSQLHSWNSGTDTVGQKLIVNKGFIDEARCCPRISSLLPNSYPVIDMDQELFNKLASEFYAIEDDLLIVQPSLRWEMVKQRLQIILILINSLIEDRHKNGITSNKFNNKLVQFRTLLEKNFKNYKSVSFYAKKLYMSPNYLNILCKRHLGLTAKELIGQRLVLEAKRLLKASDTPIKELAMELGFSEITNFSSFLKSKTGLTPTQMRNGY